MLQRAGAAPVANLGEPPVKAQPLPHRGHRGNRPHRGRPLSGQRADIDALFAQVRLQRGHDPLELAGLAQSGHLAEAQQGPVTDSGAVANGLHQRQVLIHLVAPAATGRLHKHTITIPSYYQTVKHVSPLQIPAGTPSHNTKPQVSGYLPPPNPRQPAKLRSDRGENHSRRVMPSTLSAYRASNSGFNS